MKRSDPNWDEYTVRENLRALNFYLARFEESRDVNDYDRAERHAEAVRPYLSTVFQKMNLHGMNNLYIGSLPFHGGNPGICLDCQLDGGSVEIEKSTEKSVEVNDESFKK